MSTARSPDDNTAHLQQVLGEMVAHILVHEDFEQLILWMRANAQRLFGYMYFVDEGGPRALGAMVARSVWNRTPLPGNGFRPRPVPEPGRNDPCPCGSGQKFRTCCATLPRVDAFSVDDLWIALIDHLRPDQIRRAIASRRILGQVSHPRMHPEVLSMGGRDEAWDYREHARDLSEVTPGALEWLKAQIRTARA